MGEREREKKGSQPKDQHSVDRYELGEVKHISDLAPDPNVGPSRRKQEQQRLLNPTRAGYFEVEGASAGSLGAPLHIGPELKKDGGPLIGEYEAGYNMYSLPLQSTLRAMGRVKDISMTGAPMTPAELKSRPQSAARFRKLNQVRGDNAQEQAFNQWSAHQTRMNIDIQKFGAGQHEMISVVTDFRRVQKLLEQRRAEAKKAQKTAELNKIERAAQTLATIVEVSMEVWNAVSVIEAEVARQGAAFDGNAEGPVAEDHSTGDPQKASWEYGTIYDPRATNAKLANSKQQNAGVAIAAGATVASVVKTAIDNRSKLSLNLKSMFVIAMGKAERFTELQDSIELLEAQIQALQMQQEKDVIRSASARLTGFQMEFTATRQEIQADRDASRRAAKAFGKSMDAGEQGIMTMYAAEAYQELAAFGRLAAQQRELMVDPLVGRVRHYLFSNDPLRYQAIGAARDASELLTNVNDVREQRKYFHKHLPQWQQTAKQWSDFLGSRTGAPLITEDNDADRRSHGP